MLLTVKFENVCNSTFTVYNHSGGVDKSRYMDGGGGASSAADSRYGSDRNASSSSSSSWPNSGPGGASSGKSFGNSGGGGHIQSVVSGSSGGGIPDPWNQKQADSNWRSMDQNQDRYDRTYSERKSQVSTTQYMDAPPRQNAFVGRPPQDRYGNSVSSRFDNNSRF